MVVNNIDFQKPIVIADEAQKWTEEFGEAVSDAMVSYVNLISNPCF